MIYDTLANADKYVTVNPGLQAAFEFLRAAELSALATGPAELDGKRLTINVIEADCRAPEEVQLEVHRKYIDVQYMVSGEEVFSWRPTGECSDPAGEFDTEKDFGLFADEPTGWFPLMGSCFVVFFPEDAHGPMCGTGRVRKVVVKVAVDWEQA